MGWMKSCVMADTEKDDLPPLSRQRTTQLSLAFAVFLRARQNFQKSFCVFVALCGCGKNFTDLLFLLP
jgi:hypothetical protein